jgi:hypothetical protein
MICNSLSLAAIERTTISRQQAAPVHESEETADDADTDVDAGRIQSLNPVAKKLITLLLRNVPPPHTAKWMG